MIVLVDTCIWSLAFRRRTIDDNDPDVNELKELINEVRIGIIGPIRQEILSGISSPEQYKKLKNHLRAFPDMEIRSTEYERAAEIFNRARKNGIQGSNTDFLICAVAERSHLPIFSNDKDFIHFEKITEISLHRPRLSF
ncbi:MAG: PIN domain-containing protein [SAR324 cluster bacterium]|nr:PIN domain-containing protein [SAR324 cluster bacterium]